MKKEMVGIHARTGMAVYRLPNGKLWVSKKRAELRYPPKKKLDARAVA